MRINGIKIEPSDNVVTLTEAVKEGELIQFWQHLKIESVTATEEIPQYHKVACIRIQKGEEVVKYGKTIGIATSDIEIGECVHIHNLKSACMVKGGSGNGNQWIS